MTRNEAQTRRDLIDPKLFDKGWLNEYVKVEVTPGKNSIIKGKGKKSKGRTDYLLCLPPTDKELSPFPVAVLEAKKESEPAFVGLGQSKNYQKRFNVPFAFSTNGHLFCDASIDLQEIKESISLDDFPSPDELKKRYEKYFNLNLDDNKFKPLFSPYKGGDKQRYYFQDAGIRSVILNIAKGKKRLLLNLATGTGKTVLAKHLLWKLASGGQVKKALFLVDRDELRTQALNHLQEMFLDDAQEVKPGSSFNAKILVATYQTLNFSEDDNEPKFWKENFPKNYFSHIVIDECHRSAWGKWKVILEDNPEAIHIGLTATPRELINEKLNKEDQDITSNNIRYFGNPVFEYNISDAQNDGYLAACEVNHRPIPFDKSNITKEDILKLSSKVINTGNKPDASRVRENYTASNFEKEIILDDRINAMCETFFEDLLKNSEIHQKTIIFCASDIHASLVQIKIDKIYKQYCLKNNLSTKENYVFKCTHKEKNPGPKTLIADFKDSKNTHFIATTVDLLSTGVDIPNLNNIVFFNQVNSPIVFYQMVGRGTRIGNPRGSKLMFRIYDYTGATRLFGEDFISNPPSETEKEGPGGGDREFDIIRINENQFEVKTENTGKEILRNIDGKDVLVPYENYKNDITTSLIDKIKNLDNLRNIWISPEQRKVLLENLPEGPSSILLLQELEKLKDCDLFDVLSNLTFSVRPITLIERSDSFVYKNDKWIKKFPNNAQKIILSISNQFSKGGIEELETPNLFDDKDIKKNGGIDYLLENKIDPKGLLIDTKYKILL